MAVAAPARRSASQAAPAPSRTAPPDPKKRPRDRPRPGGPGRSGAAAAAAPATAPKRKPAAPKKRKAAPSRKASSARAAAATAAPARRKAAPKRRAPGRVIPIAAGTAGRAAVAVTQLPESGLIHRLTRGRAWIGVLGVLLIGIVALNVVTLSFAASAGKVEERNFELSRENSVLQSLQAKKYGQSRVNGEAKNLGLAASTTADPTMRTVSKGDVGTAAARLAAAAAGATALTSEGEAAASEGSTSGEEAASGEGVTGEEATSGEAVMTGEEAAAVDLEGLSQEEKNAIYEETLAREAAEAEAVTE
jgi:hypothetical protein